MFLSSEDGYFGKFLLFRKAFQGLFRFQGKRGLSLEMLQRKRICSSVQGRISYFLKSFSGKLRVPLELRVHQEDHLYLLREVTSPLALRGGTSEFLKHRCRDE